MDISTIKDFFRQIKLSDYLSVAAVVTSVYFAGTFLEGERIRSQELKESMREILEETEQINERILFINQKAQVEDLLLMDKIGQTYANLEELGKKERSIRLRKINNSRTNKNLKEGNAKNIDEIRRGKGFKFRDPIE